MTIWVVVWVVLMILWLVYGGWVHYTQPQPYGPAGTLIPWACVLILGLIQFGAVSGGSFGPAVR